MNKPRPKRSRPICGCCDLLWDRRAFRRYGLPTRRAVAEQVDEWEPEYDRAMAVLDAYEIPRILAGLPAWEIADR